MQKTVALQSKPRTDKNTRKARAHRAEGRVPAILYGGALPDGKANANVVHLTVMESDLLRHLVRSDGRVVSRKQILEEVWGLHEDTDTRAIDNFIVRLRRYIEDDPAQPCHLLTVRGVGYRFEAETE